MLSMIQLNRVNFFTCRKTLWTCHPVMLSMCMDMNSMVSKICYQFPRWAVVVRYGFVRNLSGGNYQLFCFRRAFNFWPKIEPDGVRKELASETTFSSVHFERDTFCIAAGRFSSFVFSCSRLCKFRLDQYCEFRYNLPKTVESSSTWASRATIMQRRSRTRYLSFDAPQFRYHNQGETWRSTEKMFLNWISKEHIADTHQTKMSRSRERDTWEGCECVIILMGRRWPCRAQQIANNITHQTGDSKVSRFSRLRSCPFMYVSQTRFGSASMIIPF